MTKSISDGVEIVQMWQNPPLLVGEEFAKVISVRLNKPGQVLEYKIDNRYKKGNIKIVKGVVRGNKETLSLKPLFPPNQGVAHDQIY